MLLLPGAVTSCLKLAFCRPRPNFVVACWPSSPPILADLDGSSGGGGGGIDGSSGAYGGYPQCTTGIAEYGEHIKSFPSGHSSMSASGLGFLTFYLLGQLGAYSGRGYAWRVVLSCLPALVAITIGITRVTDYWCELCGE